MKHHMQLRSEIDHVMIAESLEPIIVNLSPQYYTAKTSDNNKRSNEFMLEDKFLREHGISILEKYTRSVDCAAVNESYGRT